MAQNIDILGLAGHVQNQGLIGQAQGEQRLTRRLAGQVIGGDPQATAQLAAINPQAAQSAQGFGDDQVRRFEGLINFMDQAEKSGNPAAAQQAWQAHGAPFVRQFANGTEPTQNWSEAKAMLEPIRAKIAMVKAAQQGAPGRVQSTKVGADGYYYTVNSDGTWTNSGIKADPKTQFRDVPGMNPQIVDLRGGTISDARPAGAEPAPYVDPTLPPEVQAAIRANPQAAGQVPDGGALPMPPQAAQAGAGAPPMAAPSPTSLARPSEAQTAAQTEEARRRVELQYAPQITGATEQAKADAAAANFPRMTELEADREAATSAARVTGEKHGEAVAALPKVVAVADQADALLTQAINHPGRAGFTGLNAWLDPRGLIPGTPEKDFSVLLDQIKGKAFLQAFNDLRGGGAITEREGQAATNAIARLNNAQSDAAFIQALRDLQTVIRDTKSGAQQRAGGARTTIGGDGAPVPGMVEDGFRFKGGNPADPNSWEAL